MNYVELAGMVSDVTSRPDLVAEMRIAIAGAVRKFHLADTFQQDLSTLTLNMANYPTTDFSWTLNVQSEMFNRFRRLYSAAIITSPRDFQSGQLPPMYDDFRPDSPKIPIIAPDQLFDEHGLRMESFIYLAGQNLVLRLRNINSSIVLQYFSHPHIVRTGSAVEIRSWIADTMPEAIVSEAAGTIFKMIGKDDEYQRHMMLFAENLNMLRQSAVMAN